MDQPKLQRMLQLIHLLANNHYATLDEIEEKLEMSRRTTYRYIDTLKEAGFVITKNDRGIYTLDKSSPYIKEISDLLFFSKEEACILKEAIESIDDNTLIKQNLKKKLYSLYDYKLMANVIVNKQNKNNMAKLLDAIDQKKQVIFHDYKSAHSNSHSDRLVEPFAFTTNFVQVWCFEPQSQKVKLFKVARIQSVEILETSWEYQKYHQMGFMDIFRINSDQRLPIELKLSVRAASLLKEEYPLSTECMSVTEDGSYILKTEVCNFEGVTRFILGLYDDVEILGSPGLKSFVKAKIKKMKS